MEYICKCIESTDKSILQCEIEDLKKMSEANRVAKEETKKTLDANQETLASNKKECSQLKDEKLKLIATKEETTKMLAATKETLASVKSECSQLKDHKLLLKLAVRDNKEETTKMLAANEESLASIKIECSQLKVEKQMLVVAEKETRQRLEATQEALASVKSECTQLKAEKKSLALAKEVTQEMFQAPQNNVASLKEAFEEKFAVWQEVAEEQGKMFEANKEEITSIKTECTQLKTKNQKLIETIGQINKKLKLPEDAPIADTIRNISLFEANQEEITSIKTECTQLKTEKQELIKGIGQINTNLKLPKDAPTANTIRNINKIRDIARNFRESSRSMTRKFEDEVKKSERWKVAEEVVDEVVMGVMDRVESRK